MQRIITSMDISRARYDLPQWTPVLGSLSRACTPWSRLPFHFRCECRSKGYLLHALKESQQSTDYNTRAANTRYVRAACSRTHNMYGKSCVANSHRALYSSRLKLSGRHKITDNWSRPKFWPKGWGGGSFLWIDVVRVCKIFHSSFLARDLKVIINVIWIISTVVHNFKFRKI